MCGIVGYIESRPNGQTTTDLMRSQVLRMARTIAYRGPDDQGSWVDPRAGVALGFQRLAIQDLSPAGAQPMQSASGRYVIIFNGEVYNFNELRRELVSVPRASGRGHSSAEAHGAVSTVVETEPEFRGHSDTEVLLAAVERWGVEDAVKRCVGMFAFALWDRQERVLHLCRDRIGEKPLYYGLMGDTFLFASELKPLQVHSAFRREVDRDALATFLGRRWVPAPRTIYRDVYKLPPGTILSVRVGDDGTWELGTPQPYWCARELLEGRGADPYSGTAEEAINELDRLLHRTIRRQLIADVPLGAFFSGGIDSSVVVAIMQAESASRVKTFTIGFEEKRYDEAKHARAVARHLQTEHTEQYVTPREVQDVIPRLATIYDEPFADASQIPTYLVARLARRNVTVCLSGDGGDELFCGYPGMWTLPRLWKSVRRIPRPVRFAVGGLLRSIPALEAPNRKTFRSKLARFGSVCSASTLEGAWLSLNRSWLNSPVVIGAGGSPVSPSGRGELNGTHDFTRRWMHRQLVERLPDDMLVKVDRATMAVSLESRAPLLDHQIVEFSLRLPLSLLVGQGRMKWLLRQVLYRYVPPPLVDRPKSGFSVPLGAWLRGPLRDWAEDLLNEQRLRREGFFDPDLIRQKWLRHTSGRGDWAGHLWPVLMFESWWREVS